MAMKDLSSSGFYNTSVQMKRKEYQSPRILELVLVLSERNMVAGPSVVDNLSMVEASGVELETMDFSSDNTQGFNFNWGEE